MDDDRFGLGRGTPVLLGESGAADEDDRALGRRVGQDAGIAAASLNGSVIEEEPVEMALRGLALVLEDGLERASGAVGEFLEHTQAARVG